MNVFVKLSEKEGAEDVVKGAGKEPNKLFGKQT